MNTITKEQQDYNLMETNNILTNFPLNTSLNGYAMLVDAIVMAIPYSAGRLNLSKQIYGEIAQKYNIQIGSVEKAIRGVIDSANDSIVTMNSITFPNVRIKNALLDGRPKHFISAMCEQVKLNYLKRFA